MCSEASIAFGNEPSSFHSGYQIPTQPQSPYGPFQTLTNPSTSFLCSPPMYTAPQTSTTSPSYQDNFASFSGPRNLHSHFEEKPQQDLPAPHIYTPGQSPRLVDLLLPGTNLNCPPPEYKQYRPRQSDMPYQPACLLEQHQIPIQHPDDDVEEITREPDDFTDISEAFRFMGSSSPSDSSSSSDNSILDFGSQISQAL